MAGDNYFSILFSEENEASLWQYDVLVKKQLS